MPNQSVIVLDFGGQYNQLIARRVRECNVYCEVKPNTMTVDEIRAFDPIGIIFTGGPQSVYAEGSPQVDPEIFRLGIPILGICYGCQLMAQYLGGEVTAAGKDTAREYGKTETWFDTDCRLFRGLPEQSITWMSHGDYMAKVPESFRLVAHSDACPTVGICDEARGFYGVQFHPEVNHTEYGQAMLRNFLYEVCGATGDWTMGDFMRKSIEDIRAKVGDGKVLLALSGGVDSSVAAALLAEAVGNQLTCIFVDHGLLRKNEAQEVMDYFGGRLGLNIIMVDARERFLNKLKGVTDPEQKRKIIGEEFIRVFEEESNKIGADYLVQGTIYPDVIESGFGQAAVIKSHHNVGGLPKDVRFKGIVEPLRMLFKDEVRELGESMGIPRDLVWRQPFPGPGLAIRIIGEITAERLRIVRESDAILREEVAKAGLDKDIWQYFTVFTGVNSVGVMGDERTYDYCIAIRAVTSKDAMTVEFAELPYPLMRTLSSRIINEVPGVNRVVYDITSKPPGTIEWE